MKTNENEQEDDKFMNESDEFLLHMTEQLNQELSDITVSEDLIARTLKAVKSEDADTKKKESNVVDLKDAKASVEYKKNSKKNYTKIAVRFIEIVAACFVLFVGSRFIGIGSQKKSETSMDNSTAAKEEMSSDTLGTTGSESMEEPMREESEDAMKDTQLYSAQNSEKTESSMLDSAETEESVTITTTEAAEPANGLLMAPNKGEQSVVDIAVKAAKKETDDEASIYTYEAKTADDVCSKLLVLFSSTILTSCSDEATDEWSRYIVLGTDDTSAILYKVGKKDFVVAQIYDASGLQSEMVYRVKDMKEFNELLDPIIN